MKEQVMNVAKAVDLFVAYANQELDVKVCVFDMIIHVSFCTENVHISFDRRIYGKECSKMLTIFQKMLAIFHKVGV